MKKITLYRIFALLIVPVLMFAGTLKEDRGYEYVMIQETGPNINTPEEMPVDSIFIFAYNQMDQSWSIIPFQVDERIYGPDPLSKNMSGNDWFYFELWGDNAPDSLKFNKIYDRNDDIVFLVRDMGDQAPANSWIDDEDSKKYKRVEIKVSSALDSNKTAFAYLYRSKTLSQEDIPRPYNFSYDATNDIMSTEYYSIGLASQGLAESIALPGNKTLNILDRMKARLGGVIDLPAPFGTQDITLTEDQLLNNDIMISKNSVVRSIRIAKYNFELAGLVEDDYYFWVDQQFYPFQIRVWGGDTLDVKALEDNMGEGLELDMKNLRFSWDLNANAIGMKYYNPYNQGILIDGTMDNPDYTIDVPPLSSPQPLYISSMVSGDLGTILWFSNFREKNWESVQSYYYDNFDGGSMDYDVFKWIDTGDQVSYGDNGILFQSTGKDTIDFYLDYNIYIVPEYNKDFIFYSNFRNNIENDSLRITTIASSYDPTSDIEHKETAIESFNLQQNYPNPFNNSTRIKFEIPTKSHVQLSIYDMNGRLVKTLVNSAMSAGQHNVHWNGTNMNGTSVPSGVYIYKLDTESKSISKKLILVK